MIGITGYTGFIGKILLENLEPSETVLMGRTKFNGYGGFIHFDLNNPSIIEQESLLSSINTLIHVAARVHIMDDNSNDQLAEYKAVNTKGTLNLAKQAAFAGVKRFIFLSTIKVNGESTTGRGPFTSFEKTFPIDPYGVSKLEAERELQTLGEEFGMEIVIIRPPLVYGQGVKANFASLMRLVNKSIPLPFRALRKNRRSLVSVYNLVDLIKVCITHPNAANQVFLVSDDHDLSTAEIVDLMAKVQNRGNYSFPIPISLFKILGKIFNKVDVVDRLTGSLQLDVTHTKSTLNWAPPYSVEHGIALATKEPERTNGHN